MSSFHFLMQGGLLQMACLRLSFQQQLFSALCLCSNLCPLQNGQCWEQHRSIGMDINRRQFHVLAQICHIDIWSHLSTSSLTLIAFFAIISPLVDILLPLGLHLIGLVVCPFPLPLYIPHGFSSYPSSTQWKLLCLSFWQGSSGFSSLSLSPFLNFPLDLLLHYTG